MNPKTSKLTCLNSWLKTCFTTLFLTTALFCSNTQAMNVLASSDFDGGADDFDGWTAHKCGNFGLCPIDVENIGGDDGPVGSEFFFHETDMGNPGGNLHGLDPDGGSTVLFNAPGKFLSNLSQGTTLSFDMFIDGDEYDSGAVAVPLFYVSNGTSTIFYAVPLPQAPFGEWLSFAVEIQPNTGVPGPEGDWFSIGGSGIELEDNTKFNDIFGNGGLATELRFWGELTIDDPDGEDGVLLDNVVITAPVPVPAALPLMLSALAGFGLAGSRRKRT